MDILELVNHLKLNDIFKKHLEESSKVTTSTTYGSCNYTYSNDRCECKFYEWSDLNREPKVYRTGKEFYDYLDKCLITYTPKQKSDFNVYYRFFATCMPGKSKLILTRTFEDLKTIVDNINSGKFTEKDIPYGSTTYSSNFTSTTYNHDYYDDWD